MLFREGTVIPAHEAFLIIESLGVLVPHALPKDVRVIKWKVAAEDRVTVGQDLADLELRHQLAVDHVQVGGVNTMGIGTGAPNSFRWSGPLTCMLFGVGAAQAQPIHMTINGPGATVAPIAVSEFKNLGGDDQGTRQEPTQRDLVLRAARPR